MYHDVTMSHYFWRTTGGSTVGRFKYSPNFIPEKNTRPALLGEKTERIPPFTGAVQAYLQK